MSGDYSAWRVKCPFYKNMGQNRITCEGIGGAASLHLTFAQKKERLDYQRQYCEDMENCRRCGVYRLVIGKYEDG